MSARNENFEFAREFLFSRIVDTEAGVTEEEGGEKVTTWENQVVEIYPRGNNGVEIFAILDTGARRQLRVNMRTGFMHLNPGNLRLVEASVNPSLSMIRLRVILRNQVLLEKFLVRLVSAIRVVEPEAVRPVPVQDEASAIE